MRHNLASVYAKAVCRTVPIRESRFAGAAYALCVGRQERLGVVERAPQKVEWSEIGNCGAVLCYADSAVLWIGGRD